MLQRKFQNQSKNPHDTDNFLVQKWYIHSLLYVLGHHLTQTFCIRVDRRSRKNILKIRDILIDIAQVILPIWKYAESLNHKIFLY